MTLESEGVTSAPPVAFRVRLVGERRKFDIADKNASHWMRFCTSLMAIRRVSVRQVCYFPLSVFQVCLRISGLSVRQLLVHRNATGSLTSGK